MGAEPIIAPSARKHGVSDDDIRHAYAHPIRIFDLDEGFTMIIGPIGRGSSTRSASSTAFRRQWSFTP